jgi:hypothetical protein
MSILSEKEQEFIFYRLSLINEGIENGIEEKCNENCDRVND